MAYPEESNQVNSISSIGGVLNDQSSVFNEPSMDLNNEQAESTNDTGKIDPETRDTTNVQSSLQCPSIRRESAYDESTTATSDDLPPFSQEAVDESLSKMVTYQSSSKAEPLSPGVAFTIGGGYTLNFTECLTDVPSAMVMGSIIKPLPYKKGGAIENEQMQSSILHGSQSTDEGVSRTDLPSLHSTEANQRLSTHVFSLHSTEAPDVSGVKHFMTPATVLVSQPSKEVDAVDIRLPSVPIQEHFCAVSEATEDFLHPKGLNVLHQKRIVVTAKENNIECDDYGLKLCIPENSLPRGHTHCNITITVALSGEFQFPENSVPVSAIYELTTDLKGDFANLLSLQIQHCAQERECRSLHLVTATTTSLPYSFHCLQDGMFMRHDSYGAVTLRHLSLFAIVAWVKESVHCLIWGPRKYWAQIYYTKVDRNSFLAHIFIVQNLNTHLTALEQQVSRVETYAIGTGSPVEFADQEIEISVSKVENWTATALNSKVIKKDHVIFCNPGENLQSCDIKMEYTGEGLPIKSPLFTVNFEGTSTTNYELKMESSWFDESPLEEHISEQLDEVLNINNLEEVKSAVIDIASRWKYIGNSLGISSGSINTIEYNHQHDAESCLHLILTQWLNCSHDINRYGEPSWRLLAKAVKKRTGGNNPALARKILQDNV